jgi:hypothetical protein
MRSVKVFDDRGGEVGGRSISTHVSGADLAVVDDVKGRASDVVRVRVKAKKENM